MQSALINVLVFARRFLSKKPGFDIVLQRLELRVRYQWPASPGASQGGPAAKVRWQAAGMIVTMFLVIVSFVIFRPVDKTIVSPSNPQFAVKALNAVNPINLLKELFS